MSNNDDSLLDSIGTVVACSFAVAGLVLAFWWTAIAFAGGTMPVLGTEVDGGVVEGVGYLLLVTPFTISSLYFLGFVATVIVLAPIEYLRRGRCAGRHGPARDEARH